MWTTKPQISLGEFLFSHLVNSEDFDLTRLVFKLTRLFVCALVIKLFFMLNSTEHDICHGHKIIVSILTLLTTINATIAGEFESTVEESLFFSILIFEQLIFHALLS